MKEYDKELGGKLRQIIEELQDWAERAAKRKLRPVDIERMQQEAKHLQLLISNREL